MKFSKFILVILLIAIFVAPKNIVDTTLFGSKKRLMNTTKFSTCLLTTGEIVNHVDF